MKNYAFFIGFKSSLRSANGKAWCFIHVCVFIGIKLSDKVSVGQEVDLINEFDD